MGIYLHDSASSFRIVLRGDLAGPDVRELESVWTTGKSILNGRELLVDVTELEKADHSGADLLSRMRSAGALLVKARPPAPKRRSWTILRGLAGFKTP